MKFKFGELFCGPGGLALGAQLAGFTDETGEKYSIEHLWANDYHKDSCETYRHNILPNHPNRVIWKDVRDLDIEALPSINSFAYGFPCNDFSIVGEQKGLKGKHGPLFSYGVKVLNIHKPKWFFAENVGGLKSANQGKTFEYILNELAETGPGYRLTPHLYKFEEYGIPQTRHRIIIVGISKDTDVVFKVPAPTTPNPDHYITSRQALTEPPIPDSAPNQIKTNQSKTVIERLKHIPPGENAWYEKIPKHLKLNVKRTRLSNIYKRLDPDVPSYTITGSGGGGTHGYHWSEPRALTNRERARLQTFPDDFEFLGNKESVRKQIGMAVPPQGARIIFEAIFKSFAEIDYESVQPKWKPNGEKTEQLELDI